MVSRAPHLGCRVFYTPVCVGAIQASGDVGDGGEKVWGVAEAYTDTKDL